MSGLSYHERKAYQMVTDHVPFLQKPFSVSLRVLASAPLSCDDFATKSIAKHDVRWYD